MGSQFFISLIIQLILIFNKCRFFTLDVVLSHSARISARYFAERSSFLIFLLNGMSSFKQFFKIVQIAVNCLLLQLIIIRAFCSSGVTLLGAVINLINSLCCTILDMVLVLSLFVRIDFLLKTFTGYGHSRRR